MAKEILLYGGIYSWNVASIIEAIDSVKGSQIKLRVNTPGGSVLDAYGIIAKLKELANPPEIMVDGQASSMGAFLCCYFKDVTALDVSEFTFHRAAYPSWIESDSRQFTQDMKDSLTRVNTDLRAAMESKINPDKWKSVTGFSLDEMFSLDSRIDITIDANQAKEIGLVNKVVNITPERKAEIDAANMQIAASFVRVVDTEATGNKTTQTTKSANIMTIEKIKAEAPEVYAQIVKEGVMQERDRVGAWMAYVDVDADAVAKGIEAGDNISQKAMAELNRKMASAQMLNGIANDSTGAKPTAEDQGAAAPATTEEKQAEAFISNVRKGLGLK